MAFRLISFVALGCCVAIASGAAIQSNSVYGTPRINSGEELISSIVNECFESNTMSCLKGKVLTYLDSVLGLKEEQSRAYQDNNVDKVIYDRVGRILSNNEFKVQLPETVFQSTVVSYSAARGLDFDVPEEEGEARGLLKKKLLLPVLLLLKLKLKALMPILLAIVGIKAMKALILSKIAITLVLGFLIVQLVKKTGLLGGMPMAMMPMPMSMTPAPEPPMPPMNAYGAPISTQAPPASSYDPSSWEPSSAGGPYSRVWEPSSASSSHNLAYSAYYPERSASSGSVSSSAITPTSSASSGTSSSSSTSYSS